MTISSRKQSNISFPSVQWQMLFPLQPGVVVRHENPGCRLTSHRALCVSICCKDHLWFQFLSNSQPWSTFSKGMKLRRTSPRQSPYTEKRGFHRIQASTDQNWLKIPSASHVPKFCQWLQPQKKETIGPCTFRTSLNRGNLKQFPGQHNICILPECELLTEKLDCSVGHSCSVSAHPSTQRPNCYPFKRAALSKGLLNAAPKVKLFKEIGSFLSASFKASRASKFHQNEW